MPRRAGGGGRAGGDGGAQGPVGVQADDPETGRQRDPLERGVDAPPLRPVLPGELRRLGQELPATLGSPRLLLDAVENLARRFGTDITVILDGASVVGAHAARRRVVG